MFSLENKMNILMGLVIAMFVITGAYVGYHASQQPMDEGEGHHENMEFETLSKNTELMLTIQSHEFKKSSF